MSYNFTRMRSLLSLGGAIVALTGCGPRWDFEYNFGQQRAASDSSPMLLYFTDVMSSAHYEFDKAVLSQPTVQREMKLCVNIALSYQWGPAPKQFNILKPEICVVCKPDGTEVARLEVDPPPNAEQFAAWVREARAKAVPTPASNATNGSP